MWFLGLPKSDPSALASNSFMISLHLGGCASLVFRSRVVADEARSASTLNTSKTSAPPAVDFPWNSANLCTALPATLPATVVRALSELRRAVARHARRFDKSLADRRCAPPPPPESAAAPAAAESAAVPWWRLRAVVSLAFGAPQGFERGRIRPNRPVNRPRRRLLCGRQ